MKSRMFATSLALSLITGVFAGCSSSDPATGDTADVSNAVATADSAQLTKVTFSLPGMI